MATRTLQISDFIGWMRENNRATRASRSLVHFFWRSLPNDNVKFSFFGFWRQRESAAVNSFILSLHMKTIHAKKAKVYIAYFVQRNQHGTIEKH